MSYSGSGAVATLWSPSNYNGATKIPVPSATRRYSTTSSTSTYRTGGSQERSYYSSSTNSYTTSSRNVQTEYRSRYTTPIRSSASVPTSYPTRLSELHDTTSRLTNKERSETNDNLLNYRRSLKTDNDVAAALEKFGLKSDTYKLRNDSMPNRFLNTTNLDSKYSLNRKFCGPSTLELSRLSNSSKPPKAGLSSRLQRKDSLTKSENADSSPSPIRSLERKTSSSAIGGSSSPIEIRKTSEVWDKKLSVSYGESMSRGGFDSDLFQKVDKVDNKVHSTVGSREDSEEVAENSIVLENIENEEKTLTFEEIRKKFDNNDLNSLKGGFENSQKSSQDDPKASISNGVILGVHNFGQMQYLDRSSKSKKNSDGYVDEAEPELVENQFKSESNSFSSPQTLRRTVLKPIPSSVKNSNSNSVLRKSPDSHSEVSTSLKKRSSPDLKKSLNLSPEKNGGFSSLIKLPAILPMESDANSVDEVDGSSATAIELKRDARNASITSKLGLENRSEMKIQPKLKGEKLLTKIEQTLSKEPDVDIEVLSSLARMRRSPERKPKDFENQTKVIELRRLDTVMTSPFESEAKRTKESEGNERSREKKGEGTNGKTHDKPAQKTVKPVEKPSRSSPVKEMTRSSAQVPKETETSLSSHHTVKRDASVKAKGNNSPKDEKDSHNVRERELNKKLLIDELAKDTKSVKKEERETHNFAKELPLWDKHDLSTTLGTRTFPGQASTSQSSNSRSFNERLRVLGRRHPNKPKAFEGMGLIFFFLGNQEPGSGQRDSNTDKYFLSYAFAWILQLAWVVLMLAVLASFVFGTLAPFKPNGFGSPDDLRPPRSVFHSNPVRYENFVGGKRGGKPDLRNGCRTVSRISIIFNKESTLQGCSPRSSMGRSRNSGGEKGGLNGLKNIGNTCFMNSVLQCLSNTKPLLEYLLNEDYLSDINFTISAMKGALIKAFSNVIQELWAPNTEDRIINTTNFKSQIQKFAPRFMGYAQQDAQEFLRYLLEGLHEDVNRVTVKPQQILTDIDDSLSDNQKAAEAWKRYLRMDDSKVVDIFVGQLKSTLQCTVCGHCSVTFDPFWDLSLPLPSRTGQPRLSSCLDTFTKEEVLDGEEKPTCSKCNTRRKCTKSFSIQKFPKILVLHLKRFSPTERYRGKLSVTVDFPLTGLDLSPYAANKGQGCTYNLYAISNHSGTAYGGHYTAYCKHPYTGNWHEYNDSRVSSLSCRSVVSGEAYVLFYELATQTSHL